jgi:hypothetical protein
MKNAITHAHDGHGGTGVAQLLQESLKELRHHEFSTKFMMLQQTLSDTERSCDDLTSVNPT